MTEVLQEEAPVTKAVAVEVEAEAPVKPVVAEIVKDENPVAVEAKEVETEVQKVATRAKRSLRAVAGDVKSETSSAKIAIAAEEHLIVLKMENQFLKVTTQIQQLQKEAENIQKQFPEYIKSLAAKYAVDITKNNFNALDGTFNKL